MKRTAAGIIACIFLIVASARAQAPPPPDPERTFFQAQLMRALEEKATLLMEQGKPEAAATELQRVLAIDVPKENPVYGIKARLIGRLAATYATAGRAKEAIETIQKLLAEVPPGSPAEAAAWLDAGVVYRQAGMADEALKAFDKAIELSQKLAESGRRYPPGPPGSRLPRPQPKGGLP